ncbi:hypothetical protein DITRI_Ditri12bG0100100 [Diplodiscus trichospermus]
MACNKKSKIMIFGGTGYLGRYMVKACVSMGHSTYVYTRPLKPNQDNSKLELLKEFESMGVFIIQGDLDEHEKLVSQLRKVEIVISTLAVPQYLEQLQLIKAMKDSGTIKRFVPSEYGNEVDRVSGLPPLEAVFSNKRKIRRATEAAEIPYTSVVANSFAAYFVNYLLHPQDKQRDEVVVYGSGEAKAVFNYEDDIANYTIKAALDPRAANRVMIIRPPGNIATQLELICAWDEKTGQTLKKIHVPEEEIVKLSETLPHPDNIPVAILHHIFIKGDEMSFELRTDDLEASKLFPDYKYTSIDDLLEIFLVEPPQPRLAAFA